MNKTKQIKALLPAIVCYTYLAITDVVSILACISMAEQHLYAKVIFGAATLLLINAYVAYTTIKTIKAKRQDR